jgi:uncharacterized protein YndB with AHSA1/START domain
MRTDLSTPRLAAAGTSWVLIVDRSLPQTPLQVWRALTEPDQIRVWLPFYPDRALDTVGPALLTDLGMSDPETRQAYVHEASAPDLLVLSWGGDMLRWELDDVDGGTRLTLSHTFTDRLQAPSYAAGWHLCLDALEAQLDGHPGPQVVGESALEHGYQELFDGYATLLGVDVPVRNEE